MCGVPCQLYDRLKKSNYCYRELVHRTPYIWYLSRRLHLSSFLLIIDAFIPCTFLMTL